MKKIKVNENILALLLFGAMFAGWEYLILVTAFIWAFCEAGKSLKDLTIKVLAVFGACSLVMLFWDVVVQAFETVFGGLGNFFEILVSWGVDYGLIEGYNKYFYNPVCGSVLETIGSLLTLVILAVKAKFIYSVVVNKEMRGAFWPVQSFLNKILVFANNNFYEEDKASKAPAKSRFCPKCGEKCDEDATFCTACGNKF
jgi:hypothetical protein